MAAALPSFMSEYPGYQPWYLGGDPTYTYHEIDALVRDYNERMRQQRKQRQREQQRSAARRRGRRR